MGYSCNKTSQELWSISKSAHEEIPKCLWATSQENLSLGFATRQDSNRHAQLQRLARVLANIGIILSRQRITKSLIRLHGLICTFVGSICHKTGFLTALFICFQASFVTFVAHFLNIGIKHGFPCINICQVPRSKTEVFNSYRGTGQMWMP